MNAFFNRNIVLLRNYINNNHNNHYNEYDSDDDNNNTNETMVSREHWIRTIMINTFGVAKVSIYTFILSICFLVIIASLLGHETILIPLGI